jgi:hypothetical protein
MIELQVQLPHFQKNKNVNFSINLFILMHLNGIYGSALL